MSDMFAKMSDMFRKMSDIFGNMSDMFSDKYVHLCQDVRMPSLSNCPIKEHQDKGDGQKYS